MNDPKPLPLTTDGPKPAFGCVVYVGRNDAGRCVGRVANLEGLTAEGSNEREVLASLVKQAKQVLAQYVGDGQPIPWVEPPSPKNDDEQKRFLPLHL